MSDMTSAISNSSTVFKALSKARRRKVRAEYVTDRQEDVAGQQIASAARPHPRVATPPTNRAACQTAATPVHTPSPKADRTKRFS